MDRVRIIEKIFLGSKNSGKICLSSADRGLYSEWIAALKWSQSTKEQLKFHRWAFHGKIELDLVFCGPNHWTIVEVKTLHCEDFFEFRVPYKQWCRLRYAHTALAEMYSIDVKLIVATVGHDLDVQFTEFDNDSIRVDR